MERFSVVIPCQTYIKKYIHHLYGKEIELSFSDDFGDSILTRLANNPLTRLNKKKLNVALRYFDDEITFILPKALFYSVQKTPNEQQVFAINRYLENKFEVDVFYITHIAIAFGVEKKTAINAIMQKFNIILDEDISYDAIRKRNDRLLKNPSIKNNFLVTLSSPFSSLNLRA